MGFRKRMKRGSSRKLFRKTAGSNRKNNTPVLRGGRRM